MAVIAISEQIGSCAGELARMTAQQLGYSLTGRDDMIRLGAERYGVKPEQLVLADERQPHFWERKADTRRLITFFHAVLLREMAHDRAVLVGRAVAHLLTEPACGLKVRVIGPFERRIHRVMEVEKLSQSAAERRVRDFDREMRARVQSVSGFDLDDPSTYDLVLNGSAQPIEALAEAICGCARRIDARADADAWRRMRDAALTSQVLAQLFAHPKLASAQIDVACKDGAVRVDGPGLVAPWDELVRQVAGGVEGVTAVTVIAEEPAMLYRAE